MAELAKEQGKDGVPKSHRQPVSPDAEAMLHAVMEAFHVEADAVQNRSHQPAFRAWVSATPGREFESA